MPAPRAVRALRPLRTIYRLPGLRRQVLTLLNAIGHLVDVASLSFFLMVVFGVLGLQLFKGSLTRRCYLPGASEPIDPDGTHPQGVCALSADELASVQGAGVQGTCPLGAECREYGRNPAHGTISPTPSPTANAPAKPS